MLKISQTDKLRARSWSLEALTTCPGSVDLLTGMLVDPCAGCYAREGRFRFPNVRAVRDHNKLDWQRKAWTDDMVTELADDSHFRWFDSGDIYCLALARKILEVMRRTPWCQHWLPTRVHKFQKFAGVLAQMRALPNVMVRFSSDAIDGSYTQGVHGSTIAPTYAAAQRVAGAHACHTPVTGGNCGPCRACWDKSVPVVAYTAHGHAIKSVLKRFAVIVERDALPKAA